MTVDEAPSAPARSTIRIELNRQSQPPCIEVHGLDAQALAGLRQANWKTDDWQRLLRITTADDAPAMAGTYRVGAVIRFEPAFPLVPGVRYQARFDPARIPTDSPRSANGPILAELLIPRPKTPPTTVTHVYPSSDLLPENQLKFYLHFSAPMSRGEAYEHIQLLDEAGKPIAAAFLELGEELWDLAGQRFTLLFDPGRIKQGLKPRADLGPILEAGKRYTLVIARHWPDANGNPLRESFRKSFRVGPAYDKPVDPQSWQVHPPAAATSAPLTVVFPICMDHALLHRQLWVTDAAGQRLAGAIHVADQETRWLFTPRAAWRAGAYRLVADIRLEDLAGNNIARAFEVDVFEPIQKEVKTQTVELPFIVE